MSGMGLIGTQKADFSNFRTNILAQERRTATNGGALG